MKVVVIEEANHGFLGVASCASAAIDFLIQTDWLRWFDTFLVKDENGEYCWKDLPSTYGDNWASILKSYSVDQLNDALGEGDSFWFREVEVYGG